MSQCAHCEQELKDGICQRCTAYNVYLPAPHTLIDLDASLAIQKRPHAYQVQACPKEIGNLLPKMF
jgi:hypothetical protein